MHLALLGGQYAAELLLLPPGHPHHHAAEPAWRTPYALLNVPNPADATAQDIRDAFRRLATTMHPDKRPWDPDTTQAYLRLQEAFEMLRDPCGGVIMTRCTGRVCWGRVRRSGGVGTKNVS